MCLSLSRTHERGDAHSRDEDQCRKRPGSQRRAGGDSHPAKYKMTLSILNPPGRSPEQLPMCQGGSPDSIPGTIEVYVVRRRN